MRTDHRGLRAGAPWGVKIELGEADEGALWVKLLKKNIFFFFFFLHLLEDHLHSKPIADLCWVKRTATGLQITRIDVRRV